MTQNAADSAALMILIFIAGGMAASVLLGLLFSRMVSKPIKALGNIVESVERTVQLGNQIVLASEEQAAGIALVGQGVDQMSQVVQTNSATVEQGAAASQEFSSQAELLKEKIASFKLKTDG